MTRRLLSAAAGIGGLVAVILLLGRLGSGPLATPPLLDRAELRRWLDERDAVVVAFAAVRLVALGLAWYLLVVTVLGLAARLSRVPALVRLADLATVPAVRRLLGAVAGVGITASAGALAAAQLLPDRVPGGAGATGPAGTQVVVLERLPDGEDVVLHRLPPDEDGTATLDIEESPAEVPPAGGAPATWTAQPGDHLWHVAEATLAGAWGRAPADGEVARYWTGLVEANRDVLADPSNPDLIHPGQVFRLPDPPPPG